MSVKKMINGELVTLAGAQLQQVFTGTEAEIEAALQAGTIPEGALINSLDDGDDPELTSSMILHGNDSVENKLDDIDDSITQINSELSSFDTSYVQVVADGVKTYGALLTELKALIDLDKVSTHSFIKSVTLIATLSNAIGYGNYGAIDSYNNGMSIYGINLTNGTLSRVDITGTSCVHTDMSNSVAANGEVIKFVYREK